MSKLNSLSGSKNRNRIWRKDLRLENQNLGAIGTQAAIGGSSFNPLRGAKKMVRLDSTPKAPRFHVVVPVRRGPSVQAMLREIAYVLHCTAKVKEEILTERLERDVDRLAAADR